MQAHPKSLLAFESRTPHALERYQPSSRLGKGDTLNPTHNSSVRSAALCHLFALDLGLCSVSTYDMADKGVTRGTGSVRTAVSRPPSCATFRCMHPSHADCDARATLMENGGASTSQVNLLTSPSRWHQFARQRLLFDECHTESPALSLCDGEAERGKSTCTLKKINRKVPDDPQQISLVHCGFSFWNLSNRD